ncbi:ATPase, T2SS/T4P/T4SS family [Streptococcus salivarius]|uniref:ATPase, T2SS/T4P/T4SS family n=1 Tax=Streptococcus salivarius TaxID=1304 RepID=UPI00119EF6D0|nr:ATPase, T2SS/T4P/T4SS family [Streptococcus salivarius]
MITYIKMVLKEAINNEAQDVTFFPHGEDYEVAFRKADVKQVYDHISSEDADALFSHIKFMAEMDVTEKRCSQVRTCDYQLDDGRVITIRISTIVNFQGLETMSIRLLDYPKTCINGEEHRISLRDFDVDSGLENVIEQVRIPGLHVITGCAGVGKTTLAYLLLSEAFKEGKVITIERHVEIKEMSFDQLQVNKANGMELEKLVTFVLRSNPDVLFIGEANTQEEVEAVIKAVSAGLSVVTTAYQDNFLIPHDVLEMKQGQDGKRNVAFIK